MYWSTSWISVGWGQVVSPTAIWKTGTGFTFMYVIKCTCVHETIQSAQPYTQSIILWSISGEIIFGGCVCIFILVTFTTFIYGVCKHRVAYIFSLSSFCERHQDKSAEVCTDVPCTWNKPRRITLPSEITCIDTRIYQPCPTPLVPTLENCDPRVSFRGLFKRTFTTFAKVQML